MSSLALAKPRSVTVDPVLATVSAARCLLPAFSRGKALDRRIVEQAMSLSFGGTDAQGAWDWKTAYEAIEIAQLLNVRRLGAHVARLEDEPAETVSMLRSISAAGLTHTRRNDEQVSLDQFSTPLEVGALAVLAAQVRAGDFVLEPSAGNGLVAVLAEACGAQLHLNELATLRHGHLGQLFPGVDLTQADGRHLPDVLPASGSFDVVLMNPPFTGLHDHIVSALRTVADGGRVVSVVPVRYFASEDARMLARNYQVQAMIQLPANAFYKHGTGVDTGLLVVDRASPDANLPTLTASGTWETILAAVSSIPARQGAKARVFRTAAPAMGPGRASGVVLSGRLQLLASVAAFAYQVKPWAGTGADVGIFSEYVPSRIDLSPARPHPAELVESSAMATTPLPAPTFVPTLPQCVIDSQISEAQLETVIYAGQAHEVVLPGWWRMDGPTVFEQCTSEDLGAFQCRQGFFIGDGTGVGKGTEVAAVIASNMACGRTKAVWFSKNDLLIEDARRDWCSIGGKDTDIFDQGDTRLGATIRADKGIMYSTYGTLRQPGRGDKASRLEQIVAWCAARSSTA